MKADRSLEEVDWILGIGGIEVRTGVEVGEGVTLESLEQTHDAVFLGVGLGADTRLDVPGESLPGVWGAVDFIEHMKLGRVALTGGERCVVVGGGNTALDAVREALGLGLRQVTIVYRGVERQMSGYLHEWRGAQQQGARVEWQSLPIAFEGQGRVQRVRCVRLDGAKRPLPGSDSTLEADLVLVAIGQGKLGGLVASLPGIRVEGGRVVTDASGATGRPRWFAGGDCRNGGKEVVNAAAEGKSAALAIHSFLTGARAHG
jgi:glutamate synthase (NADPH/NADH) small chain